MQGVIAIPGKERVILLVAEQEIILTAAEQHVTALPAEDGVILLTTEQLVIAGIAVNHVLTGVAIDDVSTATAEDGIRPGTALDKIAAFGPFNPVIKGFNRPVPDTEAPNARLTEIAGIAVEVQQVLLIARGDQFQKPVGTTGGIARTGKGAAKAINTTGGIARGPVNRLIAELEIEVLATLGVDDELEGIHLPAVVEEITDIVPGNDEPAAGHIVIEPYLVAAGRGTAG